MKATKASPALFPDVGLSCPCKAYPEGRLLSIRDFLCCLEQRFVSLCYTHSESTDEPHAGKLARVVLAGDPPKLIELHLISQKRKLNQLQAIM
ncbi:unnamed protein product [Cuscuta campestris]|uniref:Uncharacterized protein n=1 Tax=Cuscuta campestris TaxID=132261 RepID=A0A484MM95_9ASTE|nr:unnamed protein product [Cuscuta campestris]